MNLIYQAIAFGIENRIAAQKFFQQRRTAWSVDTAETNNDAAVREKLQTQGIIPRNLSLQNFDAFIRADVERVSALIKAKGIKAE